MDIGTAIVVVGGMFAIVTGIAVLKPRTICALHSIVTAGQTELWDAVKEMRDDIKILLQRH